MHVKVVEQTKIVQEQFHEHLEVFMRCHTQYLLVGGWSILQPKGHDYLNKCSQISNEGSIVLVFQGDHDIMITEKAI